jgi:hypothetical protein
VTADDVVRIYFKVDPRARLHRSSERSPLEGVYSSGGLGEKTGVEIDAGDNPVRINQSGIVVSHGRPDFFKERVGI